MNKIKLSFTVVIIIALIAYWGWIFISRQVSAYRLKDSSKIVKAIIINKRNYLGNSPVSHEYSYSYKFEVNGKVYIGDSRNSKFKPLDTILIKYVLENPSFNEPLEAESER